MSGQDLTDQQSVRVTMRLTYDEFVRFVANHSGHFTTSAGKRIAGELESRFHPYKITCTRHGDTCIAEYDAGFYWVRTDAYPSEDLAWQDTVTVPPMGE